MTHGREPRRGGSYRGDFHVHSVRSVAGELTPDQIVTGARDAGLDFITVTEHNTAAGHADWMGHTGDDLLVILGQEVATRTGHWLALGLAPGQSVEWRYGVRDDVIDRCVDEVRRSGGVSVAAHPHAPYASGAFMYPYDLFDAVEVWNGEWTSDRPWNADNEAALCEWGRALPADIQGGRWRPAIGNSDAHLAGQIGRPHNVVLAQDLSRAAILVAMTAGRSWIAESAEVHLSMTASAGGRRAGIGQRLVTDGRPVSVHVELAGVGAAIVSFHTDVGVAHGESIDGGRSRSMVWRTTALESMFVRVEVRERDGRMMALSNPIILS